MLMKESCTSQENMQLYPFPTYSIYKLKIKIITTWMKCEIFKQVHFGTFQDPDP